MRKVSIFSTFISGVHLLMQFRPTIVKVTEWMDVYCCSATESSEGPAARQQEAPAVWRWGRDAHGRCFRGPGQWPFTPCLIIRCLFWTCIILLWTCMIVGGKWTRSQSPAKAHFFSPVFFWQGGPSSPETPAERAGEGASSESSEQFSAKPIGSGSLHKVWPPPIFTEIIHNLLQKNIRKRTLCVH